jgi:hypothetical protein
MPGGSNSDRAARHRQERLNLFALVQVCMVIVQGMAAKRVGQIDMII